MKTVEILFLIINLIVTLYLLHKKIDSTYILCWTFISVIIVYFVSRKYLWLKK
jgi:hypothetical protein